MENHIASAEDFREANGRGEPERVVLPKLGRAVLLRRPTPMWFLFHGQLPTSLAARAQNGGPGAGSAFVQTAEDLRALADWMVPLLQEVFVQPRLSTNPGPGEISPELLDMEDANFVIRWAVGEIQGTGDRGQGTGGAGPTNDLGAFRD
ncbi:MAG TPA: hypothetical protein VGW33_15370 [Terriglobia bacterium]|nr:hypothetical protein [Terriglobia bacterium]